MSEHKKNKAGLFLASALVPVLSLAVPAAAFAQTASPPGAASTTATAPVVPPAAPVALPPLPLISSQPVHLTPKEAYGLKLAGEWKNHPDRPRRGQDGSVVYLYGATMPVLICTPLEVCAIRLQPGEVVNDVHAGDIARWRINPATSGSGSDATTYVVVKPTDAGLTTDLFITTNRRSYTIKLISDQHDWIPLLSFDYPSDIQAAWASYRQHEEADQQAAAANYARNTIPSTGQNLANLDFNYRLSGDHPDWMPLRVYTDGLKTYIQFPGNGFPNGAPALVELGKGGLFTSAPTKIVNYRIVGDRYVVDQVLQRAALISGVGSDQERVVITHEGH
ncbi:MAG: P-type conjugative transfer protein TrbG [Acidiphilium sp.]|nr:P-type conjugative transfer protein TrbG [Acidiphilium sp.]MDD4937236.1 P-type conjugative transfer protein TrbG [Acidiphilium sp.]